MGITWAKPAATLRGPRVHGVSGARAHGVSRDLAQGPVRTGSIGPVDTGVPWARYMPVRTGSSGPPAWEVRGHGVAWELLPSSWRFLLRFQASLLDGVDVIFLFDSSSMNV